MNPAQERYRVRMAALNGRIDPSYQREVVARFATFFEKIAEIGLLPEEYEMQGRVHANNACAAFGLASIAERSAEMTALDFNLALVDRAMNADEVAGNLAMAGILGLTS
jgi:hypothetical protein